ncbi:MAG: hydroxymethylbilane synthase [Verrucomicrobiota bacterium]|jgi:hydroxymethylbilane synthase
MMKQIVLGSRGSALAVAQIELTEAALAAKCPGLETRREIFVTRGDQKLDLNLLRAGEAGGKGLFTKELEEALLSGSIDVAIHSLKDLPGNNPEGLELVAVLERAPVGDVLVSKLPGGLDALPQGARVGTSSIRRARQLAWLRPDLKIEEWRGNVPTRLRKFGENADVSAIVLAEAGLRRLHYALDFSTGKLVCESGEFCATSLLGKLLPAIGQGAVALQARADRAEVREVLAQINHEPTMIAIRAEREVQRLLSGDCSLPVGVSTELNGDRIAMRGILFGAEGRPPGEGTAEGHVSEIGRVAAELVARISPLA